MYTGLGGVVGSHGWRQSVLAAGNGGKWALASSGRPGGQSMCGTSLFSLQSQVVGFCPVLDVNFS